MYITYLNIFNYNTKYLEFNAFIILYPLSVLGGLRCVEEKINQWKNVNIDMFNGFSMVIFFRALQACFVIGFIIIYSIMFYTRRQYYNKETVKKVN